MQEKQLKQRVSTQPITKSLSMRQLYREVARIVDNGIDGYRVVKKYEDPTAQIKSRQSLQHPRKLKQLKRGSYLEDQFYRKKDIPGVCSYDILEKQKTKQITKRHMSPKMTYLDQAIQRSRKDHVPAPGFYNMPTQIDSNLMNSKRSASLKNFHQKVTYLDNAEYEGSITPGVGEYQINRQFRLKSQQNQKVSIHKPQYWRKHHMEIQKIKKQKAKKEGPGIAAYNPKPIQYQLFEHKKKIERILSQHKLSRDKSQRFKTEGKDTVNLGPGKYNLLNQWASKQKNKKGVLSIISKLSPPSIYYK